MLHGIIVYAIVIIVVAGVAWVVAQRLDAFIAGWPLRIQARYVKAGQPPGYHDRLKAIRALYAAWTHEEATVWQM
ncbi:hypothetical protein BjapCC829_26390 [Bradyrhizobium barranii]|uniref:Uncharacterized protein n=1 Tax=Bradyrhizobium barranii TaxID=2992140 RepID=A0ABY3QC80_9BRAD|nr:MULTISPECIES: hypothetical protein [Bradyrhizobium]MCS3929609.1 hypothetical protein [Bradyrhizobium elkanii]MCS3970166.1 hypothetical protein [Bradyrhizobium japonicum]UFW83495.1 hypothetical protein BjapCC829_26390 [Bradyrhizobium japonicum]CUU18027.1 hypothetical protein CDS [Bradyrhizobium sp.]